MARLMWRGVMRWVLGDLALPASSPISAAMYSSTAARYTPALGLTRRVKRARRSMLVTRPTGNTRPARFVPDLEGLRAALPGLLLRFFAATAAAAPLFEFVVPDMRVAA